MRNLLLGMTALLIVLLLISSIRPAPTTPPEPPQEEKPPEDLEDFREPLEVMDIYLYMDHSALNTLYSRNRFSDVRLPGTIRLSPGGKDIELEGIRFRGNTARLKSKKSFSIQFIDRQDFLFHSRRMNLNAMWTDPSMMREKLAMGMFHELNQPASRTQYFNLYINDVYEGLYVHIERVEPNLLEYHGLNPDGTLLRDQFRQNWRKPEITRNSVFGFNIDAVNNPEQFLEENFNYRREPDWSSLVEFASWVHNTPAGPEFAQVFEKILM